MEENKTPTFQEYIRRFYIQPEEKQRERVQRFANYTELLHATLGLSGEVGEFVDMIKKIVAYGKEPDPGKIREELGDILHYLCRVCDFTGNDLDALVQNNVTKLNARYKYGYSNEAAIAQGERQTPVIESATTDSLPAAEEPLPDK